MKKYIIYLLSAIILLSVSCHRQKLEDPKQLLAYFPISVDWSESLIDENSISHISIYFYPNDGGEPLVYLSDDIYFNLVKVPKGSYSVLIFNELPGNIKGVDSREVKDYSNHQVGIIEDSKTNTIYYEQQNNELLVTEHNRVASWHIDEVVVDESMIEYTRSEEFAEYIKEVRSKSKSKTRGENIEEGSNCLPHSSVATTKANTKAVEELLNVIPQPETTIFNVRVRVENLNSAMYFKAIAKGCASGAYLSSDDVILPDGANNIYYLDVLNRKYDNPSNGVNGYVNFTFNSFGRLFSNEHYEISFRIVQTSGISKKFERDITDQVVLDFDHEIDIDLTSNDDKLILDGSNSAGFDVSGWDDDVIVHI